MSASLSH